MALFIGMLPLKMACSIHPGQPTSTRIHTKVQAKKTSIRVEIILFVLRQIPKRMVEMKQIRELQLQIVSLLFKLIQRRFLVATPQRSRLAILRAYILLTNRLPFQFLLIVESEKTRSIFKVVYLALTGKMVQIMVLKSSNTKVIRSLCPMKSHLR